MSSQSEPAVVVLSWDADAPARANHPDAERPNRDDLVEGQQAAEDGLRYLDTQLEDVADLCRLLAADLDRTPMRLVKALRVIAARIDTIKFELNEESERLVPLANLAAWYHRACDAQEVTR